MLHAASFAEDGDDFQRLLAELRCKSAEFTCDVCRSATDAACHGESAPDTSGVCDDLAQIVPLGLWRVTDVSTLLAAADVTMSLTHLSDDAPIAAQLVVLCMHRLLNDTPIMHLLDVAGFIDDTDLHHTLLRVGHVVGWGSVSRALKHIGRVNNCQLVASALYLTMRYEDDPLRAIRAAEDWHPACAGLVAAFSVTVRQSDDYLPMTDRQIEEARRWLEPVL